MAFLMFLCSGALARAQISPGPLSKAHASLDGPTHCTECHNTAVRPPEFKCLDCHRDIRERLVQNRGLHPALTGSDHSSRSCLKCHSDHNGLDFAIVHWDTPLDKFDHRRAGYALEGKHAGLSCQSCHKPEFIPAAARADISTKDLTHTYLGLPQQCLGCHTDEHHGQLASDCTQCHDLTDWKKAAKFDHSRAAYALTGAHAKIACQKCHPQAQDVKTYAKYKGIAFEDCTPCHSDPHKGAFSGACKTCHASDIDWKPSRLAASFDHSKTRYPLLGKHAAVPCASCHKSANFKQPVQSDHCDDCHKKDPHNGQFATRPDRGECAACHTVNGFKPSTFGVAQHSATQFPLRERHLSVACAKCHLSDPKGVVYRVHDYSCAACHDDAHGGQFRGAPYQNRCENCHTQTSFKPSTFTPDRHPTTRYSLTGAHLAVTCVDCHKQQAGSGGSKIVPYHFEDISCTGCHEDPHHGQFSARMRARADAEAPAGCQACHTTKTWHKLQGFDHDTTDFPLQETHRGVLCSDCHKPEHPAGGIEGIRYSSASTQCAGCHDVDDVHGGQFVGRSEAGCAECHDEKKWKPSHFDHDTQSNFKLIGAHRKATCSGCHMNGSLPSGEGGVIYVKTPKECAACH